MMASHREVSGQFTTLKLDSDDLPQLEGDIEEEEFIGDYEEGDEVHLKNDDDIDMIVEDDEDNFDMEEDNEEILESFATDEDNAIPSYMISKRNDLMTAEILDAGNEIINQQRAIALKSPVTGPIIKKNPVTKVVIQSKQYKVLGGHDVLTKRTLSLAEAKKMGVISSGTKIQTSTGPKRVVLKNTPLSNVVSVKSSSRIIPSAPVRVTKPVATSVHGPITLSTLRSNMPGKSGQILTTGSSSSPARAITVRALDGKASQQYIVRSPSHNVVTQGPIQVANAKPQFQLVKLVNSSLVGKHKLVKTNSQSSIVPIAPQSSPKGVITKTISGAKRVIVNQQGSTVIATGKVQDAMKKLNVNEDEATIFVVSESNKDNLTESNSSIEQLDDVFDDEIGEKENLDKAAPREILEANGIRPKKPCNCTKSQCLKLYCECFASGEFCFQCNCTNCFNNIEHEEARQQSVQCCLDRNPTAFRPKFTVHNENESTERQPEKGCNCKRSGCLKNYCECFESRRQCTNLCKCTGCQNIEETAASERASELSSLLDAAVSSGQSVPSNKFLSPSLAAALCQCILAQADVSEKKGEKVEDTERRIIEEFGQCLVQIIGNRNKKDFNR